MIIIPNEENLIEDNSLKQVFYYCNDVNKPIFKTKEIFKTEKKIIFYPYSISLSEGIKSKKIKIIELRGWATIADIPNDFKSVGKYGLKTQRLRTFVQYLYPRFKQFEKLVVGIGISNRFSDKTISINWSDLSKILNKIGTEKRYYDSTRKVTLNNLLSDITTKFTREISHLNSGQLDFFLQKFDSFDKISKTDVDSLARVLETSPASKISITNNFIKTKDKINKVFLEEIIKKFEKLMSAKNDNEKQWQTFFGANSWVFSHLFPFEVILRKQEAYVGGKTIDNEEGRVVDYLFDNGFKDNYALIEIKTHNKQLLKNTAYRKPDAFAYSDDLSGGISQCLDQKEIFLIENGSKAKILNPKCILVIGLKSNLNENQSKCFELLRSNQKNVDIVTFDELLAKLKGLLKVLNS
mgnify:CR=1 FL=1